jgi:hypothetical protein
MLWELKGQLRLKANGLGCIAGLPSRQTPGKCRGKRRGSGPQVCPVADQRQPKRHRGIGSHVSTPCRPSDLLPGNILGEIRLKTGSKGPGRSRGTMKAQVNRLQRSVIYRLDEWSKGKWSDVLESLDSEDKSLWKVTRPCEFRPLHPPPPPQVPGGLALSDCEKAEALADSLGSQLQSVVDPSDPAVTETVDKAMCAHKYELQVNRHEPIPRMSHRPSEYSRLARL